MSVPDYSATSLDHYRLRNHAPDPLVPRPSVSQTAGLLPPVVTRSPRRSRLVPIVLIALSVIGGIGLLIAFVVRAGALATSLAAAIALLPLLAVTATFWWLDRWEPEPAWHLLAAFAWGAGAAAAFALVTNTTLEAALISPLISAADAEAITVTMIAPVAEEVLKATGLVAFLVVRRRDVTSPLDGVVLAGFVGAGFAFSENIVYFLSAGSSLVGTFVARALASPFCHSMFTSLTGLATALALTRLRGRSAWMWATPIGVVSAICLHAAWNASAHYGGGNFLLTYLVVWVPFFLGWILLISITAAKQRRWIEVGLESYVAAGWLHASEASMVTSLAWRRLGVRQATNISRKARRAMIAFQRAAARLGLTYVRGVRLGASPDRIALAHADLADIAAARAAYADEWARTR